MESALVRSHRPRCNAARGMPGGTDRIATFAATKLTTHVDSDPDQRSRRDVAPVRFRGHLPIRPAHRADVHPRACRPVVLWDDGDLHYWLAGRAAGQSRPR